MFSILIIKTMFYTGPLPEFNKIFLSRIKTFHERKKYGFPAALYCLGFHRWSLSERILNPLQLQ